MKTVTMTELRRNLSKILDEVESQGTEFLITRYGRGVAVLIPWREDLLWKKDLL